MALKKTIEIDGIAVPFKASAALPRMYRIQFRRDIYKDLAKLSKNFDENKKSEAGSAFPIESLEVFENIAYMMAKHAAPDDVPADTWLEQFNTFSVYEILPRLMELWGMNVETQIESKKNLARLTAP